MKKFNFRLETVLDLRKNREQVALRELAAAQRVLQASLSAKADFQEGLKGALFRREKLADQTSAAVDYAVADAFIIGLKQQIVRANGVIQRAQKNVDRAMRAFLAARKATMAIEKLKERDLEEYKVGQRRREARQQDDLAVMRSRILKEGAEA